MGKEFRARPVAAVLIDVAGLSGPAACGHREGTPESGWVLLDYGDVVVHVQHADDRVYYALERLWADCPVVDLPEDARGGDGQADPA